MKEAVLWYFLCNIPNIGRKTIRKLLAYFETVDNIFNAEEKALAEILNAKQVKSFLACKNVEQLEQQYNRLQEKNVMFLYPGHSLYPKALKEIPDAPFGLYLKGKMPKQECTSIAIVGTRNASVYGREMAGYFARELSKAGINIISGLALGVDGCAHKGALEGNGYTMGILGGGINVIYPREHFYLYREMEQRGGILSEYGLDVVPKPGLFPERNRLISGMAKGVLVVEAKERSGSLITVDQGLEQGKDIFVLPGRVTDENSKGCHQLIRSGAILVESPSQILEELNLLNYHAGNLEEIRQGKEKDLALPEKMVYSCLSLEPAYIDVIVKQCRMSVTEVLSILLTLELKGYIKQIVKNYYIISI